MLIVKFNYKLAVIAFIWRFPAVVEIPALTFLEYDRPECERA